MSDKPSYLGLLNAISIAEGRANTYLRAWAECTPSDDVRRVLLTVAAREGEHQMSFAKRINELGYEVRTTPEDGADAEKAIALVRSDRSDLEKMRTLKLHKLDTGDKPDVFDNFFKDHSIDVRTGELLGRYIAEERDSARLLRNCYEQLAGADAPRDDDRIAALEEKLDTVCAMVEELCATVAPNGTATSGSGRSGSGPKARVKK
jgi:rubrerythrin